LSGTLVSTERPVIAEFVDVHRHYVMGKDNVVRALNGVSMQVQKGDYLAIMGRSGSGKSTMLNILGCLDRPTSGEYRVGGRDVSRLGDDQLSDVRGREIGFIFQSFNLIPVLTAAENVELPLLLTPLNKTQRAERVRTALRVVGLEERMHHKPRELSGGQEQRVAIARAIVSDPTILVCDEPTGDLDRQSADDILNMLVKLNKEFGKTIFMVTHDAEAAERATIKRTLKKGQLEMR